MLSAKFTVVYLEILTVCLLFALVMRIKVSRDLGTKYEVRAFQWLLHFFMAMVVFDAVAQLQRAGFIDPHLMLMRFCNSSYMFSIAAISLVWIYFSEHQIAGGPAQKKWFPVLLVCMAVVYAVICYGSVRSGWLYDYDAQGTYQRGPLYFAIYLFSYISMTASSLHALARAAGTTVPARKRRMYTIAAFSVAPFTASFLQWMIGRYPTIIPGLCIGFMFVFVSLQDDSINLDALMGLNNRKSMDRYLEDLRGRVSELTPYYVFILDADDFKSVNDRQGHIEGDRALRRIAEALRMTGDLYNGFIARFGGDEFIAVISGKYLQDPEIFVEKMNEHLAQVIARTRLGYALSVSVGYARYASSDARIQELIGRADEMLYRKKKERG